MSARLRAFQLLDRLAGRVSGVAPALATRLTLATLRRTAEPEYDLLGSLASRDRLSLDIGANIGTYALALSRCSRAVIAFEPNPEMAAHCRRAVPAARVENCALGAAAGKATLTIPLSGKGVALAGHASLLGRDYIAPAAPGSLAVQEIEVPVRTLDSFGLANVGFIKIDVEGFEMSVLDGGWQTISRDRPAMLIECDTREDHGPADLVARLAAIGYRADFWHEGALRPFDQWHPGLRAHHGGPMCNFIFRQA